MGKKSVDRTSFDCKGQVTIFIILGMIILFSAIFFISLSSSIQKKQFENVKEEVVSKLFEKEGLRIFVEDCLTDQIEEGLFILGQQGRIWNQQGGGIESFSEGINGLNLNNNNISYGINWKTPLINFNSYPCNNEDNSPQFCKYKHPNITVGYGTLELTEGKIKTDLKRYLKSSVLECVNTLIEEEVSRNINLESENIDLSLTFKDDGISAKVNYPLRFEVGGEEFFQLSKFDFFYETKFKKLLNLAIIKPLTYDQKFLDFNYKSNLSMENFNYLVNTNNINNFNSDCNPTENENIFECTQRLNPESYQSLSLNVNVQELTNGDDLFIFTAPANTIINRPETYTFQFLRKNRPPALDYIGKFSCGKYDYIAIENDLEFGNVDIKLNASDADEDEIILYSYEQNEGDQFSIDPNGPINQKRLFINNPSSGIYNLTLKATDEHFLSDWQDVQILVDRPLNLGLEILSEFKISNNDPNIFSGQSEVSLSDIISEENVFIVSGEDPTFIKLILPDETFLTEDLSDETANLNYQDENDNSFNLAVNINSDTCYSFPYNGRSNCNLENYNNDINQWDTIFNIPNSPYYVFNEINDFTRGELTLSFLPNYCPELENENVFQERTFQKDIIITQCIPNYNPEVPAYVPGIIGNENPFLATHACCEGNAGNPSSWKVKEAGTECYEPNTNPGCYGQLSLSRRNIVNTYTMMKEVYLCDGIRGNICPNKKYKPVDNTLTCGRNNQNGCLNIDNLCQDKEAYFMDEGIGWCSGNFGCERFTNQEIVYIGNVYSRGELNKELIKDLANNIMNNDEITNFKAGCGGPNWFGGYSGSPCDKNFDGIFEGTCNLFGACR